MTKSVIAFLIFAFASSAATATSENCKLLRELRYRDKKRLAHLDDASVRGHNPIQLDPFLPPEQQPAGTKLIATPVFRQPNDYTCGPSALASALGTFGVLLRPMEIARKAKTRAAVGTEISDLVSFATSMGFKAEVRLRQRKLGQKPSPADGEGMTMESLKQAIDENKPVLVIQQAYLDAPHPDYTQELENGHYVLVVGYTPEAIIIMDPTTPGRLAYVPKGEFQDRWHLLDGPNMQDNIGIILSYDKPGNFNPSQVVSMVDGRQAGSYQDFPKRADIPMINQRNEGWSGVASLVSLMNRFEVDPHQEVVGRAMKWNASRDASITLPELVAYAESREVHLSSGDSVSLNQIETLVSGGTPVMIRLRQADNSVKWVVVFGFNRDGALVMDPTKLANFSQVSRTDLAKMGATGEATFPSLWPKPGQTGSYDAKTAIYMP